jgi:Tol biopolymer transport system component
MNLSNGEELAITEDAFPFQPNTEQEAIVYCCARWSSDGTLLAYRRDVGIPVTGGFESSYSLWVYDPATSESRAVLEDQLVMGYAWKPGEHLIAYGLPIETEYFMGNRPDLANGIWAVDMDSGETYELVPPQRDITLLWPVWSPDGRFLSFDEVRHMEGRGQFAYYDFEAQEYIAWDQVIGDYDWSPDGEMIAYDTLAYIAGGAERIWLSDRKGEGAQPFSPALHPGYASSPAFSPQGERIAYMAALGGPQTTQYTLMIQDIDSADMLNLGNFEQVTELTWSADGTRLIFAAGPYENREIMVVQIDDRAVTTIAVGNQPALQP